MEKKESNSETNNQGQGSAKILIDENKKKFSIGNYIMGF